MDEKRKPRYVLLSIHPKYVERIISGKKYYEFSRCDLQRQGEGVEEQQSMSDTIESVQLPTRAPGKFPLHADRFVFYSTSPEKKIVAVAEKSHVLVGDLEFIWEDCKEVAGVGHEEFEKYYEGCTHGVAVGLTEVKRLREPISLERIGVKRAPQSFMYLSQEQWKMVERMVCQVEWR